MTTYEFSANGMVLGRFDGVTVEEAREAFAKDSGYHSWGDMTERAEEFGGNTVEIAELLSNGQPEPVTNH